jgi:hypothetical protein
MNQPRYKYPTRDYPAMLDETRIADALEHIALSQRRQADSMEAIQEILLSFVFGKPFERKESNDGQ